MGGACRMHEKNKKCLKGRHHLENLGVDGIHLFQNRDQC